MDLDMKSQYTHIPSPNTTVVPPRFILSLGGGPWFIISLKPLVYSNKQNAFSSLAQWFSLDALGPIWFYLYTVTELQFL